MDERIKYCDGGSSYCKIYENEEYSIIPTKKLVSEDNNYFDCATGYAVKKRSKRYVNQLIALAEGGLALIKENDFTILDIGGRDTKYITFKDRELSNLNWNVSCGGNMGFTVEILGNYYNIDYRELTPANDFIPVACGLLGIEKVFDEINNGNKPEAGVAKFLNGMAKNTWHFVGKPKKIYLSGGFCINKCFVKTLEKYCEVETLGRFVPLVGLLKMSSEIKNISLPKYNILGNTI